MVWRQLWGWGLGACLLLLAGCASQDVKDYAGFRPHLVPSQFFSGDLYARGIVRNFHGEVIRTFNATLHGHWNDQGIGTLDERFVYNDGEVQKRTWTFTPVKGGYRATAGDVVQPGIWRFDGNATHMNYVLRVPYQGSTVDLTMDDWMFAVTPDTVINQTEMSKWGIDVGEVVLVIQRGHPPDAAVH